MDTNDNDEYKKFLDFVKGNKSFLPPEAVSNNTVKNLPQDLSGPGEGVEPSAGHFGMAGPMGLGYILENWGDSPNDAQQAEEMERLRTGPTGQTLGYDMGGSGRKPRHGATGYWDDEPDRTLAADTSMDTATSPTTPSDNTSVLDSVQKQLDDLQNASGGPTSSSTTTEQSTENTSPKPYSSKIIDIANSFTDVPQDNSDIIRAQEVQNQNQLYSNLGKAGNSMGAALTYQGKADNSYYNDMDKRANQPVKNLLTQNAYGIDKMKNNIMRFALMNQRRQNTATTAESEMARHQAFKYGYDVPTDVTAANLKEPLAQFAKEQAAKSNAEFKQKVFDATQNYREKINDFRTKNAERGDKKMLSANEKAANILYSKDTTKYTDSLDAAARLEGLLHQVKSGKLKSAPGVANAMTTDLGTLLTGSKQTTVHDKSQLEIKAFEKTMAELESYKTSKATDTIPPSFIKQMEVELHALKEKVNQGYFHKHNELLRSSSLKEVRDVYQNRYNSQMMTRYKSAIVMTKEGQPSFVIDANKHPKDLEDAIKEGYVPAPPPQR